MSLEQSGNEDSEYIFKIVLTCLWTKWQCKKSDQFIKSLCDETDVRWVAILLMSQRNVGKYGTQPVGNQSTLGLWGLGLNMPRGTCDTRL